VPAQEGQFGHDRLLVAAQERLIVPAGYPDELTPGSAVGRADGGSGQRRLILVADEDQQRAPRSGRFAPWPVETEAERRTGGDLLLPVRVPVTWVERSAAVQGIRRREQRYGARLPGERHQPRRAASETADGIDNSAGGEAEQRERPLVARRVARGRLAIGVRRLGDRRGELRMARRDAEDVTT
jgi:hypothetical protein